MGNRIVAGRDLDWNDAYTEAPVVVVSENFAREFWKEPALAVGRRIRKHAEHSRGARSSASPATSETTA